MRKLILALMTLACLSGGAEAQQQQKFTADQGKAGAAPWPVTWGAGLAVNADLRIGGNPVATGNPVPVSVGNAFVLDATAQAGNTSLSSIDGKLTGAAKDGADPASPAVANSGAGIRGWLATIAGQLGGTLKTTLQAGTAIVGRFGIDQTTPGTTNGVVVNSGTLSADIRVAGAAVTGANAVPTYLPGIANAAGTAAGTALTVQGTAAGLPIPTTVRGAGTNRSATVGTTAVTLMAANTSRQGWKIKNDSAGDIWINFDATATAAPGGGNIKVPAGSYLSSEPGFVETGAMSAIGSAAGLAITAREH
jgi:hypothetical protein